MIIHKIRRDACSNAEDLVVVIDVIRAFTTAAFAFNSGAEKMVAAGSIDEAFNIRANNPSFELMGELNGSPIDGFHYSNSPAQAEIHDFRGKTLILRTSSGTQGIINCHSAKTILASSFVIAEATVKRIQELQPSIVTFVITGNPGEEDLALADYLEARLNSMDIAAEPFLNRVKTSTIGIEVLNNPNFPGCSKSDLESVLMLDRFKFAMEIQKENNQFVMRPHYYD